MKTLKAMSLFLPTTIIYMIVLLLVYAAISKLLDFDTFIAQLAQSPLLSAYAKPVAYGLPAIELIMAVLLITRRFRLAALYCFFCLMAIFTAYIVIILNFTNFVPCSCGGVLDQMGWTEHLIFNLGFMILSCIAIYLVKGSSKGMWKNLSLLGLSGAAFVSLLHIGSDTAMARNNAFLRRYVPHPVEKVGRLDLGFNSYYIAGMAEGHIYLGNVTTPLQLLRIDTGLQTLDTLKVAISNMDLPYKRVRVQVVPPFFYVGDGTVPILFRGTSDDWKGQPFSHNEAYFKHYAPMDSTRVAISTLSASSRANALGYLERNGETVSLHLNDGLLSKQVDGRFDSDGMLLYNQTHERQVYVYHYRNAFEVADTFSQSLYSGTTIDTISRAIVDVAHYASSNSYKLGPKTLMVNKLSATDGDFLYIHTDRLGRYENEDTLNSAGIVDVYDIRDGSYAFSFYLYHQRNKKLSEILVHNDWLVAIVDDQLWLYRLKDEFFKSGP